MRFDANVSILSPELPILDQAVAAVFDTVEMQEP